MKKKWIGQSLVLLILLCSITSCGEKKGVSQVAEELTETNGPSSTENNSMLEEANSISMEKLLLSTKEPLGATLYVWGGGWNEADDGAGKEAVTIGVSPAWKAFFDKNDASYDYHNTKYQIHDGLDCSGYVGWVIYNTFETESGKPGYVMSSTDMAKSFSEKGWGSFTEASSVSDWKPGDIMSMKGHVWIALGTCEDQSVLLIHASPPGVRICGTLNEDGSESMAVELARTYTRKYYKEWDERYPVYGVSRDYLVKSSQMRWKEETFPDAKKFQSMKPEEILEWMFEKNKR